ncbi:MAG TPA: protein kinase [Polyangiaceae bacterium]|nr:protein kinase [Polyangiaceae bacterium]
MSKGAFRLGRILVVDDEPSVLRVVQQTLKGIGYDVETADGGAAAMALLQDQHFDLVITDLFMPDVSGQDLLEAIRQAGLDTDVLMMSAAGSITLAVDAMKHGARGFIEKPFKTDAIRREVRAIFGARASKPPSEPPADRALVSAATTLPGTIPSFHSGPRQLLGRYEVVRTIGEGGMGRVYEAFDPDLQRHVAIKVMLPENDAKLRDEFANRFKREGRVTGQLAHPNVATVYDCGLTPDGGAYMVMEMVRGGSLRQLLDARGRLSVAESVTIGHQVASALHYAHKHDIIHRDVKPENILFGDDDLVKLVDYGIAKVPMSKLTGDRWVGSPAYFAPELVRGLTVDFRSDQFALGTVMFEMLTGKSPFAAGTLLETLHNVIERDVPGVTELEIDEELRRLLLRLLEKDPERRFSDERALVRQLQAMRDRLTGESG